MTAFKWPGPFVWKLANTFLSGSFPSNLSILPNSFSDLGLRLLPACQFWELHHLLKLPSLFHFSRSLFLLSGITLSLFVLSPSQVLLLLCPHKTFQFSFPNADELCSSPSSFIYLPVCAFLLPSKAHQRPSPLFPWFPPVPSWSFISSISPWISPPLGILFRRPQRPPFTFLSLFRLVRGLGIPLSSSCRLLPITRAL